MGRAWSPPAAGRSGDAALQPLLFPAGGSPVRARPRRGGHERRPARARTGARLHGLRLRSGPYRPRRDLGADRRRATPAGPSGIALAVNNKEYSMAKIVTAAQLRDRLHSGGEIAIVDAREEGSFHERHLLMASCLPLSRLQLIPPAVLPPLFA